MRTDRQTDGRTGIHTGRRDKANSSFSHFCESAYKRNSETFGIRNRTLQL